MNVWFCDSEVFAHDTLWVFKSESTGEYKIFHNDNHGVLTWIQEESPVLVGWNIYGYDQHILKATLSDWSPEQHKRVNDTIFTDKSRLMVWQMFEYDTIDLPPIIDLFHDIVPRKGLKEIEANLGMSIEESSVPFDLDRPWTKDELAEVTRYCIHDVDATEQVYNLRDRQEYVQAKLMLAEMTNVDPFALTPVTNAKAVSIALNAQKRPYANETYNVPSNLLTEYVPAEAVTYAETIDTDLSIMVKEDFDYEVAFRLKDAGFPVSEGKITFDVVGCPAVMGIGGIHAAIDQYVGRSDDEDVILIQDIASYYPSLILNNGYMSRGVESDELYREFYDMRLEAKLSGDKTRANAAKLVLNTTYGAMKDRYNRLFDPIQGSRVCLSGQLYIIELINLMHEQVPSLEVIQINTDGWVIKLPRSEQHKIDNVLESWYSRTKFKVETDEVRTIIQRDVNNYIIEFSDKAKGIKTKGGTVKYFDGGDFRTNSNSIIDLAVTNRCLYGIPVEDTINECDDLSRFQIIAKAGSFTTCYQGEIVRERVPVVPEVLLKSGKPKTAWQTTGIDGTELQKVNRIYATNDHSHGEVIKVQFKDGEFVKASKIPLAPDHAFVDNEGDKMTWDLLDRDWYIQLAEKKADEFMKGTDMAENKNVETTETKKAPTARRTRAKADPVVETTEVVRPPFQQRFFEMCKTIADMAQTIELDKEVSHINYEYAGTQKYKTMLREAAMKHEILFTVDFIGVTMHPIEQRTNNGSPFYIASTNAVFTYRDAYDNTVTPLSIQGFGVGQNGGNASYAAGGAQTNALRNHILNEFLLNNQGSDGDDIAVVTAGSGKPKSGFVSTNEREQVAKAVTANKPENAPVLFAQAILDTLMECRAIEDGYGQATLERYFEQGADGEWTPKVGDDGMSIIPATAAKTSMMPKLENKLATLQGK